MAIKQAATIPPKPAQGKGYSRRTLKRSPGKGFSKQAKYEAVLKHMCIPRKCPSGLVFSNLPKIEK